MRHVVRLIEGYAIRPSAPAITAVVRGTSLRIVLVPIDLGHLPPLKGQLKVLPPEAHSQPVEAEAEAEAGAVPWAARAQ